MIQALCCMNSRCDDIDTSTIPCSPSHVASTLHLHSFTWNKNLSPVEEVVHQSEVLYPQRRLRVTITVRTVRTLLPRRNTPAKAIEHRIQDLNQTQLCQRLVCLTLSPSSQESAENKQHFHLAVENTVCTSESVNIGYLVVLDEYGDGMAAAEAWVTKRATQGTRFRESSTIRYKSIGKLPFEPSLVVFARHEA